jgi:hypothetical protein
MDDKRTIAWFSAFVIVVILIGVASGILLDRFLLRPPPSEWFGRGGGAGAGMGRMGPGGMRGDAMGFGGGRGGMGQGGGRGAMERPGPLGDRLARELELSKTQKDQVDTILNRRRTRLEEIRTDMQGRMQKEQADLRAELRALLNEKQQKRFDDLVSSTPGPGGMPGMRRGQ